MFSFLWPIFFWKQKKSPKWDLESLIEPFHGATMKIFWSPFYGVFIHTHTKKKDHFGVGIWRNWVPFCVVWVLEQRDGGCPETNVCCGFVVVATLCGESTNSWPIVCFLQFHQWAWLERGCPKSLGKNSFVFGVVLLSFSSLFLLREMEILVRQNGTVLIVVHGTWIG